MKAPLTAPTEVPTIRSGGDPALIERAQHAGLHGAEAGAAGEDEGRLRRLSHASLASPADAFSYAR